VKGHSALTYSIDHHEPKKRSSDIDSQRSRYMLSTDHFAVSVRAIGHLVAFALAVPVYACLFSTRILTNINLAVYRSTGGARPKTSTTPGGKTAVITLKEGLKIKKFLTRNYM